MRGALSSGSESLHGCSKKRIDGSGGFLPIEKLLDHTLRDGTSSETSNVDDIMHVAPVDAAVATASLKGALGVAEVIHVQFLGPGFENAREKQCHQAEHR